MKIGVDFDGTYNAIDSRCIDTFILCLKHVGVEVSFVTARAYHDKGNGNEDIERAARYLEIPIVYCAGRPKAACYEADIWLDDNPKMIPLPTDLLLRAANINTDYGSVLNEHNNGDLNIRFGDTIIDAYSSGKDRYKPEVWRAKQRES